MVPTIVIFTNNHGRFAHMVVANNQTEAIKAAMASPECPANFSKVEALPIYTPGFIVSNDGKTVNFYL